jgi:hypothetical protein
MKNRASLKSGAGWKMKYPFIWLQTKAEKRKNAAEYQALLPGINEKRSPGRGWGVSKGNL